MLQTIDEMLNQHHQDIVQCIRDILRKSLLVGNDFLLCVLRLVTAGKIRKQPDRGITVEDLMTFLPNRVLNRLMMYHVLRNLTMRVEIFGVVPPSLVDALDQEITDENIEKPAFYFRQTWRTKCS
jgi:hypothetical protein